MIEVPQKEIKVIEKEIAPLYNEGKSFVVKSEADKEKAAELINKMDNALKLVEERRTKITKPINDSLKSINDLFRPFKTQLEGGIKLVKQQVLLYVTEQEEIARKEAERIAKRVEKGTMKKETAANKLDSIKSPIEKVSSSGGGLNFRKVDKIRIVDVSLIPREYLVPDEDKIFDAVIKGGVDIPGVEKYQETVVAKAR